jgi:hypothetical protein
VQDVIDLVQNGESEVEIEISDTDESDEDSDEDVCKEVDKENQPPMVCPDDNYVYPTTYPTVTLKTRRA